MGFRKVKIKPAAARNISAIAWFIESNGLLKTAEKFTDAVYDHFIKLADDRKSYAACRDYKEIDDGLQMCCIPQKYTIVFIEEENEIIICEFLSSKLIH